MAVIHASRKMVPMTSRVRRVGCKKSVPNRKNWYPLKKKLLAERIEDDSRGCLITYNTISLRHLHQKIRDKQISDWEKGHEEVTSEIDYPAEDEADVHDMPLQQDSTNASISAEDGSAELQAILLQHRTAASAERGVSHFQDMLIQHNTIKTLLSVEVGVSDLQTMPPHNDIPSTQFLAEDGHSCIIDMSLEKKAAETCFSAKGDTPELGDMSLKHGTGGTHFSNEGFKSYPKETSLHHDTAMTKFPAEESESYVLDTYCMYDAAEGSNDIEVASEGISQVNKWVCHVCKNADVSVAVLPCRHLCLCTVCEPMTRKCPVCEGPKKQCFYVS